MKHPEIQPKPGLQPDRSPKKDLSRRKFLHSAAVAGAAAATLPIAGIAQSVPEARQTRPEDPMESVLTRHGSEFGELNRIR